ncbi:serine/threonine-protein kinase [Actinomadura pelletieri DSM 43383]|uniref:non-specific serine/threonine protein kinase n=1 Tax=Actinomadura pelletieri DSM 43383 TaxID=1120940 RepID=A0A495QBB8_9ACTN|nr:cellulose binding domain-containing protein [Actinomadura pelletieri]RKS68831.1 serine/threonine-protein kinase [Actinomadura pelletieri DSM 43383]
MPEIVAPGDRLGERYRLDRPLGAGGMATVWRAVDLVLDRAVAVKVPREGWPEEFTRRLRQEAKAAAGLAHPSITGVHDYGEQDGVPYVVMELLDGESLAARLARGPLPWHEAAEICARVADALAAAHAAGIVHRDIKPANIFLATVGVKVLDFGIAFTGPATPGGPVLGTPAYVAPELLSGTRPTAAADVFSLGVVLHEAVTGLPVSTQALPPDVPGEVAALCRRCLSGDPGSRPAADEAARVLAEAAGVRLARPRPPLTAPPATAPPLTMSPGAGSPRREPNPTRVLDEPLPAAPPPVSSRRPLVIAGTVVGAAALMAGLLAALAPDRSEPPTSSVSPTGPGGACAVSYRIVGTWDQGFQASVRITNLGSGAIDGWTLSFEFPDGQTITQLWNGGQVQNGSSVRVTSADWNRAIPPNGTADFGFLGRQNGANGAPSRFVLNGDECRP